MKTPLSKEVNEDFWNDCFNEKEGKVNNEFMPYNNYTHFFTRNMNNKKKFKNNGHFSINMLSQENKGKQKSNNSTSKTINKTIDNTNLSKIYKNHQFLKDNLEIDKVDKELEIRKKNAMMRCFGLYAYGVEVKKAKILNDENNKKEKVKDEMSHCTFRPKISKYDKIKQTRFFPEYSNKNNTKENNIINSNGEYKLSNINNNSIENGVTKKNIKTKNNNYKNISNEEEDQNYLEECTFRPKISKKNIKKVFEKTKSLANEKDNAEFILRYTKARQEYMIKKLKKISTKDDCYDSFANRINNKRYKNDGNEFFENKIQKYNKKGNMSMDHLKNTNLENKKQINFDKNIINSLRNELLGINLNEEE